MKNPFVFPSDKGPGMTLRDYFAGQVMAGICANSSLGFPGSKVKIAYKIADQMLKERDESS